MANQQPWSLLEEAGIELPLYFGLHSGPLQQWGRGGGGSSPYFTKEEVGQPTKHCTDTIKSSEKKEPIPNHSPAHSQQFPGPSTPKCYINSVLLVATWSKGKAGGGSEMWSEITCSNLPVSSLVPGTAGEGLEVEPLLTSDTSTMPNNCCHQYYLNDHNRSCRSVTKKSIWPVPNPLKSTQNMGEHFFQGLSGNKSKSLSAQLHQPQSDFGTPAWSGKWLQLCHRQQGANSGAELPTISTALEYLLHKQQTVTRDTCYRNLHPHLPPPRLCADNLDNYLCGPTIWD